MESGGSLIDDLSSLLPVVKYITDKFAEWLPGRSMYIN